MPYHRGDPITETIMAYHDFLITVIVNSVIWVVISTLVNQHYWKYTDLKKEFHLISNYIDQIRKKKSGNNFAIKLDDYKKENNDKNGCSYSCLNTEGNNKTSNLGSPLII